MRVEKILVQTPPLVRIGGETSREQLLSVLAQAGHVFDAFQDLSDFFLHAL